jgi:hypothetical protein
MPRNPGELYEPPRARQAIAQAAKLRGQYANAVQVIQGNRALSREEKRVRLAELHQRHQQAMAELRRIRHQDHRDAARQAVLDFAADESTSPLRMDVYQRLVLELVDKPIGEIVRAYDVAEMIGNSLGMRAAAVAAIQKRGQLPNDPAEALVARFAQAREPDGNGGTRYRFPKASIAWERLTDLEAWERQDHLAADAAFSVAATPDKPQDPTPVDPVDAARADVAQLYSQGNGQVAAQAGGGGDGGEPPTVAG